MYFSRDAVLEAENPLGGKNDCLIFLSTHWDLGMFAQMFLDSNIAKKKCVCRETKATYPICFGLAPYFRKESANQIAMSFHLTNA